MEGNVHSSMFTVLCMLSEIDLYPTWITHLYHCEVLSKETKFRQMVEIRLSLPWPFANRNSFLRGFAVVLPERKGVAIGLKSRSRRVAKENDIKSSIKDKVIQKGIEKVKNNKNSKTNNKKNSAIPAASISTKPGKNQEMESASGAKNIVELGISDLLEEYKSKLNNKVGVLGERNTEKGLVEMNIERGCMLVEYESPKETIFRCLFKVNPRMKMIPNWLINYGTRNLAYKFYKRFRIKCAVVERGFQDNLHVQRILKNTEVYDEIRERLENIIAEKDEVYKKMMEEKREQEVNKRQREWESRGGREKKLYDDDAKFKIMDESTIPENGNVDIIETFTILEGECMSKGSLEEAKVLKPANEEELPNKDCEENRISPQNHCSEQGNIVPQGNIYSHPAEDPQVPYSLVYMEEAKEEEKEILEEVKEESEPIIGRRDIENDRLDFPIISRSQVFGLEVRAHPNPFEPSSDPVKEQMRYNEEPLMEDLDPSPSPSPWASDSESEIRRGISKIEKEEDSALQLEIPLSDNDEDPEGGYDEETEEEFNKLQEYYEKHKERQAKTKILDLLSDEDEEDSGGNIAENVDDEEGFEASLSIQKSIVFS